VAEVLEAELLVPGEAVGLGPGEGLGRQGGGDLGIGVELGQLVEVGGSPAAEDEALGPQLGPAGARRLAPGRAQALTACSPAQR